MYRIRFHGRGGQGMKTSSRILGTAFFFEGYEVQDSPKYGAERRGAPMSAYVRAGRRSILERGVIHNPGLVVVADESLLETIPETLTDGLSGNSIMLVNSRGNISEWIEKHNVTPGIAYLPIRQDEEDMESKVHLISTACAAAAAGLTGVISWKNMERAVREEHSALNECTMNENIEAALYAYNETKLTTLRVHNTDNEAMHDAIDPRWISMKFEHSGKASPAVHNCRTSVKNPTGSWRVLRPVIKEDLCSRCSLCGVYCPDNAVNIRPDGFPGIDYVHCKGCLICLAVCPKHAIETSREKSSFKRSRYRGEV